MGYFANGTENMMYVDKYCERCVHELGPENGCPCMDAHLHWNYDECNNDDSILHKMIPRNKEGFNDQCVFFKENIPENRYVQELEGMVYPCKVCGDPCSDICQQCIEILKNKA